MNLSQLEYFCILAKYEHYTKAAQILSISQPSLTHSIKSLEKELNVSLFDRQGRHVKLNRFGKVYLKYIENVLAQLDEAKGAISLMVDPTRGKVKIAYLTSLGPNMIPKLIRNFKDQEGNQSISFEFIGGTTATIKNLIMSGDIDLALTSKIEDPNIACVPLYKEQLYAVVPKGHELATQSEITLEEIAKYSLIGYKERSGIRTVIDDYFIAAGIRPNIAYEFTDDRTICGFVEAGLGVAIVPEAEDIDSYDVVKLSFRDTMIARGIYLSYFTKSFISVPTQKLIEYILTNYKVDN